MKGAQNEPRFDLELLGFPGRAPQVAAAALAPPFGITREEALRYVEEAPLLVVKGCTEAVLCAYVKALHDAGADLRVLSRTGQVWVLPAPARIAAAMDHAGEAAFADGLSQEDGDTVPTWLAAQTTLPDTGYAASSPPESVWSSAQQPSYSPKDSHEIAFPEDDDFVLVQSTPPVPRTLPSTTPTWGEHAAWDEWEDDIPATVASRPFSAAEPRLDYKPSGQYARVGSQPGKPISSTRVTTSDYAVAEAKAKAARELRGTSAEALAQRVSSSSPSVKAPPAPEAPPQRTGRVAFSSDQGAAALDQAGVSGLGSASGSTSSLGSARPGVPSGARVAVSTGPRPTVTSGSKPAVPPRTSMPSGGGPSVPSGARPVVPAGARPSVPSGARTAVSASASGMGQRPGAKADTRGPSGSHMIPVSGRRRTDDDSQPPVRFYEVPAGEADENPWVDRIPTGEVFNQGLVLLRQQREERGESLEDVLRRTASTFSGASKHPKKKR